MGVGERAFWVMTAGCAVLLVLAVVEMLRGNETAVNGVVGAGFGVVASGVVALVFRHDKI